MKLEMTLPSNPGFIHALPCLDLLALILMFPLLGSSFVSQAGLTVTVHESPWRYQQMNDPVVVTLGVGDDHPIWVNKKRVSLDDLEEEIEAVRKMKGSELTTAVVRSDVSVPSGFEKEVVNRILKMGLNCGLLGRSTGRR